MDSITFRGKRYPATKVSIREFGERLVSVESLEKEITQEKQTADPEARAVDSTVFFYVPDWLMECPNRCIAEYVEEQVA